MNVANAGFLAFVERRRRLAGFSLVEGGHPFFMPTDALEAEHAQTPGGLLNFAHYDYLGLAHDARVKQAAIEAITDQGTGAGASRLVGGERLAHRALETGLAGFFGIGDSLAMISGYLANASLIPHVLGRRDLVVTDELAHNSILAGCRGGKFEHATFTHNDLDGLDRLLGERRGQHAHVLIVAEGLYSMDGDIVDLPRLLEIKERHRAWLMLDEAHSYGVLGASGRGLCEHFDIDPARVEFFIGTLSKTFGASGGFIGGAQRMIEWLRFTLPGFVYSVGLSPATVAGTQKALDILRDEPQRVAKLSGNARRFLEKARAAGLNTGDAGGHAVVPVLFATAGQTAAVSSILLQQGIYAPPIFHVGVPKDLPRIRFFLSSTHTHEQIDRAIAALSEAAKNTAERQVELK